MAKSDDAKSERARPSTRAEKQPRSKTPSARRSAGAKPTRARTSEVAPQTQPTAAPSAPLSITSHRELIAKRTAMVAALTSDPDRARLLFANPALAFREAGVKLSPAIANHITHAIQQPPRIRTRREELTATLKKALQATPHPSDEHWLAEILFAKLHIAPLQTAGHEPLYIPAVPPDAIDRLRALLPRRDSKLPARQPTPGTAVVPVWRLDLDAEVPSLPRAKTRPKTVSLPELWFYLPSHELVHPLLELGILEVSVLRVLPADAFAKVRDRQISAGFVDWIESVKFPTRRSNARPP